MHVIHLVREGAAGRATEQQQIDQEWLPSTIRITRVIAGDDGHLVDARPLREIVRESGAIVIHSYGAVHAAAIGRCDVRWIAEQAPVRSRSLLRRQNSPAVMLSESGSVLESVRDHYLDDVWQSGPRPAVIGSVAGVERSPLSHQAFARIMRTRDDVEWREYETVPEPHELDRLALWVDPSAGADGGSLEAIVRGLPTIASREPLHLRRSDDGAAARLVPPRDANELAHAVVNAIFRPETMEAPLLRARAIRHRFAPSQRAARLVTVYESGA